MKTRRFHRLGAVAGAAIAAQIGLASPPALAQTLSDDVLSDYAFREIGPAVFSGRIVDIELAPGDPYIIFVAGASGGLFKSINNGTTWSCIFQNEGTISIGDIAIDPNDPNTIWIGTGEANNQRSSYWGDGIYKTTDGGETWNNVGLRDSHHIGRIVIDPNDSDTVYVAALGHLYTFNDERGLYKTTDGGETWQQSLAIDDKVGIVDVVLDPSDSNTIYAASYERLRRAWHFDGAGPGSAIYKSTDGGESWSRVNGGLPAGNIGRIGLAISENDPQLLYATVSNQNPQDTPNGIAHLGMEGRPTGRGYAIESVDEDGPASEAGLVAGDVITKFGDIDAANSWALIGAFGDIKPGDQIDITFDRAGETMTATLVAESRESDEGGRQVGGEIYRTTDGGETWERMNERPVGGTPPYYYGQIRVDPKDDNQLYLLGVPVFASSDGGANWSSNVAGSVHVDHHALVIDPTNSNRLILGNDGGLAISYDKGATWDHFANIPLAQFYAVGVDMQRPYHVYGGTQDNGTWGGPSASTGRGISNEAWYRVGGGDGFYAQIDPTNSDIVYGESQFGAIYRLDKSTGRSQSLRPRPREGDERYRFNWNSPILISNHNPQIIYFGGNRLFKSFNRGDDWAVISDDLTTQDEDKLAGNVPHCTITTIAESPIDPNLLLVGTDDGLIQKSTDGGLTWTNITGNLPDNAPANWWISRVELSRFDRDTAYASITGYREDDFRPLAYRTTDGGETWALISGSLPDEPVNVIREDPRNQNVLWLGTEFGAWVSLDTGSSWTKLTNGLPTIPVHDLVIHPRDRDLVLATHGRGFFIMDVAAIQELTQDVLDSEAHLFTIENVHPLPNTLGGNSGFSGNRHFFGSNAPGGVAIAYYLGADNEDVSLTILNVAGDEVATLDADSEAGLHRVTWNLTTGGGGNNQGRGQGRRGRASRAEPGTYTALLTIGETEHRQTFEIEPGS